MKRRCRKEGRKGGGKGGDESEAKKGKLLGLRGRRREEEED